MTNDEAEDRYSSLNIAENDSSRGRYNIPDTMVARRPEKVGHEIM